MGPRPIRFWPGPQSSFGAKPLWGMRLQSPARRPQSWNDIASSATKRCARGAHRSKVVQGTMELFLNLLWLLIAVSAFGAWHMHVSGGGRAPGNQRRRGWIALACSLVLLFFVISMTDDLHAEVMVVEDANTSRRHVCALHACPHDVASNKVVHHQLAAVVSRWLFVSPLRLLEFVASAPLAATLSRVSASPGRAPPSLSL